jgi:hypothetical protein
VPVLSKLPVHPDFDSAQSDGPTIRDEDSAIRDDLFEFVDAVSDRVGAINHRTVAEHVGTGDVDGETIPTDAESVSARIVVPSRRSCRAAGRQHSGGRDPSRGARDPLEQPPVGEWAPSTTGVPSRCEKSTLSLRDSR